MIPASKIQPYHFGIDNNTLLVTAGNQVFMIDLSLKKNIYKTSDSEKERHDGLLNWSEDLSEKA